MDTSARTDPSSGIRQHKRATSAVLRSMMSPNYHSNPSSHVDEREGARNNYSSKQDVFPTKKFSTGQHLREKRGNQDHVFSSPDKNSRALEKEDKSLGFENGFKASRSLKSLVEKKIPGSPKKNHEEMGMKKSKSSTGLSALLSRPRANKATKSDAMQRDKENQRPTDISPPPIWAQFATQPSTDVSISKVPLNDGHAQEISASHTQFEGSPRRKEDTAPIAEADISRRPNLKPRPKSECLPASNSQAPFAETLTSLRKLERGRHQTAATHASQQTLEQNKSRQTLNRRPKSSQGKEESDGSATVAVGKRGSRVMATVAALNGKQKALPKEPATESAAVYSDPNAIETAFETLLDARNVPQNTRDKMRTLDTHIKADFIRKDKSGSGSASSAESLAFQSRPSTGSGSMTDTAAFVSEESQVDKDNSRSPKKPRPRSRTFTFSKSDQSPSKKHKSSRPVSRDSTKSGDSISKAATKSSMDMGAASGVATFSRSTKPAVAGDFISYVRKTQNPEAVEVGKIHKLRQLLRNESVAWVDTFIAEDGMTEVVGLLYRIIQIEWREEHEDTLLHETLLCIKALSTTSSALQELSVLQTTLFPTLLKMLFDEEKKGPSEFSTRTIIIQLLLTYLSESSSADYTTRAHTLLTYLRDQRPPEDAQPPGFITSIYQPRPYRVWNREIVNVTKEVFWIFLHHMNIVPYPSEDSQAVDPASYRMRHFPKEHPPVPAAPYIGGVEWDATAYLTAHLDLLNGLIASLPTCQERNALRQELKDSGFEKVMGISLRTCKEKFYGSVHDSLAVWVAACVEDEWPVRDVREGPPREEVRAQSRSPKKKRKGDEVPRLDMPKLNLDGADGGHFVGEGWL